MDKLRIEEMKDRVEAFILEICKEKSLTLPGYPAFTGFSVLAGSEDESLEFYLEDGEIFYDRAGFSPNRQRISNFMDGDKV